MISSMDIAWIAGFLEGEGSFILKKGNPVISVTSTDYDVIARFSKLVGYAVNEYKPRGKATYKTAWWCRVHGSNAIAWMMTIYTFMGERRKEKIKEIIDTWKASLRIPRAPRGKRWKATCHPDRNRAGKGLCAACYMKEWRKAKKEKTNMKRYYGVSDAPKA